MAMSKESWPRGQGFQFLYYETGSPFEEELMHMLDNKQREFLIAD